MSAVGLWNAIFEPGFLSSGPVDTALVIGGLAAIVSGLAGTFTISRGQSFAGHSLSDVGAAGGSAAVLLGISPLLGFIVMNLAAAPLMGGNRRVRARDEATGIVLGFALGVTALFLYLDTTYSSTTNATQSVLFGSIFTIQTSVIPVVAALSLGSVGLIAALYRPLLLMSISPDLAKARGIGVAPIGFGFLIVLAMAVSLSAMTVGAVLSTALLIGPAATAIQLTKRPGLAMGVATVLGLVATWLGILFSYDSYIWFSDHRALPVSFVIVACIFVMFVAASAFRVISRAAGARSLRAS